jgi:hypothetical protein
MLVWRIDFPHPPRSGAQLRAERVDLPRKRVR